MLSVKYLAFIFVGRSNDYIYARIRALKRKYNLRYKEAELPVDVQMKELGLSRESIFALTKIAEQECSAN